MRKEDVLGEVAKTAPPVSVAGATVMGVTLQEWVLYLTAVYTLLQIAYFIRKLFKEYQNGSL